MHQVTVWSISGVFCLLSLLACSRPRSDRLWKSSQEAGSRALEQGSYIEAEKQFKAALTEAERFGDRDERLALTLDSLAECYRKQGKFTQAETLYWRSLVTWQQRLGPKHPKVAAILNELAVLYSDSGSTAEAESLYQRSLAIRERALGPDHLDVATSLENYAVLLRKLGRGDEAEKLAARAKQIRASRR